MSRTFRRRGENAAIDFSGRYRRPNQAPDQPPSGRGAFRDGAAQTMRGLDRCPPAWFRNVVARKLRGKEKRLERLLLSAADVEEVAEKRPMVHMPWYT